MSKNITIKEGGMGRQFGPESGLTTKTQDGGSCLWIPKSEIPLTTKSITKNGVYKASDDNAYGYSQVMVNVTDAEFITGKDSDGNEVVVSKGSDGSLAEQKVPTSIKIVTPPDYLGPYGNRANILFAGLTVEALYSDGTSAGMVNFDELIFPATQAVFDPSATTTENASTSELDTSPCNQPISSMMTILISQPVSEQRIITERYTGSGAKCFRYITGNGSNNVFVFAGESPFTIDHETHDPLNGDSYETITPTISSFTNGNKTVYYGGFTYSGNYEYTSVPSACYNGYYAPDIGSKENAAWTVVFGETTFDGGNMDVPVQWIRPQDGKMLETSFGITVINVNGNGDWGYASPTDILAWLMPFEVV